MKQLRFAIISILIMTINLQGQWEIVNQGIYRVNDIDFVDEQTGWISSYKYVYQTFDAGENWLPLPVIDSVYFQNVDFLDGETGWAIVNTYYTGVPIILKTSDGGQSWFKQLEIPDINYLRDIFLVSPSIVFAFGDSEKIFKTVDGGETWTDISPVFEARDYLSLYFLDEKIGFVSGQKYDAGFLGVVLTTIDGGLNWEERIFPEYTRIKDIQYTNNSPVYFLAETEDYTHFLCETTNGFNTTNQLLQSNYFIPSYFLTDDKTIHLITRENNATIMKSINGGLDWDKKQNVEFARMDKIFFPNTEKGLIFGGNNSQVIWESTDSGNNWSINKLSNNFEGMSLIDKNRGFVYSSFANFHGPTVGNLFFTEDGGQNWEENLTIPNNMIVSSFFVEEKTGFLLVGNRQSYIYKTDDGGKNWNQSYNIYENPNQNNFYGEDLFFANENQGWIVGSNYSSDYSSRNAVILETTNGGRNWDLVWEKADSNQTLLSLNSIHAKDNNLWAVGNIGLIVNYSPQTGWNEKTDYSGLPLRQVFFSDKNHGWISGGWSYSHNRNILFMKTEDAGDTWQKSPDFNYFINDMHFESNSHGWVVGQDTSGGGVILETLDGGEKWTTKVADLPAALTSIDFKDGSGWVAGNLGLLLRTQTNPVVIDESKIINFELDQNKPNPFNSTTKITYRLISNTNSQEFTEVNLKIYNVLGQKVATLVSKQQAIGTYTVEWDASKFPSGVYFCGISSKYEFLMSRKLLLLK